LGEPGEAIIYGNVPPLFWGT